jgi:hypothetical protein
MVNATNGAIVNQAVRRWALARVLDVHESDPVPDPGVAINGARFAGRYFTPFGVLTVASGEAPNTLFVTTVVRDDTEGWKPPVDPPITLAFFAADHAVSLDAMGPQRVVRFGFDDDGRVEWFLWGSRRATRID